MSNQLAMSVIQFAVVAICITGCGEGGIASSGKGRAGGATVKPDNVLRISQNAIMLANLVSDQLEERTDFNAKSVAQQNFVALRGLPDLPDTNVIYEEQDSQIQRDCALGGYYLRDTTYREQHEEEYANRSEYPLIRAVRESTYQYVECVQADGSTRNGVVIERAWGFYTDVEFPTFIDADFLEKSYSDYHFEDIDSTYEISSGRVLREIQQIDSTITSFVSIESDTPLVGKLNGSDFTWHHMLLDKSVNNFHEKTVYLLGEYEHAALGELATISGDLYENEDNAMPDGLGTLGIYLENQDIVLEFGAVDVTLSLFDIGVLIPAYTSNVDYTDFPSQILGIDLSGWM